MKNMIWFSLTVLFFFMIHSCEDDVNPIELYRYSGYDATGVKIITGTFSLEYGTADQISGKWDFNVIGNPANIGPQVGTGEYVGSITKDMINMYLNPEFADNNVNLTGTLSNDNISGWWYYSGIQGVINQGIFTAKK